MTLFSRKKIISQKGATDLTSTNARITVLENNEYKITYYEVISGTSGSLTIPSQATINAGEFGLSGNAILSKIDGSNKPTFESPKTSGGVIVTASLTTSTGAWVTSGTYTDSNVALIYSIKIKAIYRSNLTYANIIEEAEIGSAYIKNLTSDAQTQIDSKLTASNNLSDLSNPLTARNNLKMWDLFLTGGNQSTTSNVSSNITDLVSPTLTASKRYRIHGVIKVGCNNTGGIRFQITLPSGASMDISLSGSNTSNTTYINATITSSATLSASVQSFNGLSMLRVDGEISLGVTAGTIQFGFASGTNTQTSTVYQLGTQLTLTQIN